MGGFFQRFTTRDLIIIAALAGIGIAIKPIVGPLSKMISTPLMVPGGSFTGGLYMLWMVLAALITGKRWTATLFGLVQGLVVMIAGLKGNQGLFSLVSYSLPGLAVDLLLPLLPGAEKLLTHLVLCSVANMVGAGIVAVTVFRHPPQFILIILGMALISGCLGGWISQGLYKTIRYYEIL